MFELLIVLPAHRMLHGKEDTYVSAYSLYTSGDCGFVLDGTPCGYKLQTASREGHSALWEETVSLSLE